MKTWVWVLSGLDLAWCRYILVLSVRYNFIELNRHLQYVLLVDFSNFEASIWYDSCNCEIWFRRYSPRKMKSQDQFLVINMIQKIQCGENEIKISFLVINMWLYQGFDLTVPTTWPMKPVAIPSGFLTLIGN